MTEGKKEELNGYDLSRAWFNWCFENPEMVNPNHTAIYFFAIEHCNRLGWKTKFGFPTQMAMDALGIKKHQTYIKYFNELVEWGFIKLIQKSANQYSANVISLIVALPKNGKALDKALIKHGAEHTAKQTQTSGQSNSSVYKQRTINKEQLTKNNTEGSQARFDFKKSLVEYGFKENLVEDWLRVRKTKNLTNTETAFTLFISEIEKRACHLDETLSIIVSKSWGGFKWEWVDNLEKNGTGTKEAAGRDTGKELNDLIERRFSS